MTCKLRFGKAHVLTLVVVMALILGLVGVSHASTKGSEDWDQIIAAAKKEGKVVMYANSGRVANAGKIFEAKYGIKVESAKMDDVEVVERIIREADAGVHAVDVAWIQEPSALFYELIPGEYVTNYVPPTHTDIIPIEYQDPLVLLFQVRIFGYNNEAYSEAPIQSLWDLTTKEWEGRFVTRNPLQTSAHLSWFSELVFNRADELAADYERRFGEPLKLTTPNAGWEFLKRLAENRPVLVTSDTDVSDAVGARGQTEPPIGLYVLSKHRDIEVKDLALAVATEVTPAIGYYYPAYLQMMTKAPHPNAAKLLISFLLEEEGVSAWTNDLGTYPTNPNIPPLPEDPIGGLSEWSKVAWTYDVETAARTRGEILDFWIRHAR